MAVLLDNFKTALLSHIGSQFHAEGANLIGDNGAILGHAGKVSSLSVVAGVSAEIAGGSVNSAVAGAFGSRNSGKYRYKVNYLSPVI